MNYPVLYINNIPVISRTTGATVAITITTL
jgi:hypothetical protein